MGAQVNGYLYGKRSIKINVLMLALTAKAASAMVSPVGEVAFSAASTCFSQRCSIMWISSCALRSKSLMTKYSFSRVSISNLQGGWSRSHAAHKSLLQHFALSPVWRIAATAAGEFPPTGYHEPPVRIVTALAEDGITWKKGETVEILDGFTGEVDTVNLPDELSVDIDAFNKRVITESFNRVICTELAEHIDPSLPGKTLIFCATDNHVGIGATPERKKPEYWNGNIPWVSSGEVAFCRIEDTKEFITKLGLKKTSTELHPKGTVLIGMIGEGKTRGQVAILDIEACNNQNSAAIRVSESGMLPEYVYYFLESQYLKTRTIGSGNNQQALNKSRVQAIFMPLPPFEEHKAITQRIQEALDSEKNISAYLDESIKELALLDQSILAKAFRGELVPQDPNDEPASLLLDRIKQNMKSAPCLHKKRKGKGM